MLLRSACGNNSELPLTPEPLAVAQQTIRRQRPSQMPSDEEIQKIVRAGKEENLAVREAIGISPDFRPLRTVYNAVASVVVASVEHHSSDRFERRLFFRHTSERAYHSASSPPPDVHYDDLVTSSAQATTYYTVRRITKRSDGFGGDWQSVDRFDLKSQTADTVISRGAMQLPEDYAHGWVSRLYGVATDESALYCSCAFQGAEKRKVHYWLCRVTPHAQVVTLLSRLEAVWF